MEHHYQAGILSLYFDTPLYDTGGGGEAGWGSVILDCAIGGVELSLVETRSLTSTDELSTSNPLWFTLDAIDDLYSSNVTIDAFPFRLFADAALSITHNGRLTTTASSNERRLLLITACHGLECTPIEACSIRLSCGGSGELSYPSDVQVMPSLPHRLVRQTALSFESTPSNSESDTYFAPVPSQFGTSYYRKLLGRSPTDLSSARLLSFLQTSQTSKFHGVNVPRCSLLDDSCSQLDRDSRIQEQLHEVDYLKTIVLGLQSSVVINEPLASPFVGKMFCKTLPVLSNGIYNPGRLSWLRREMSTVGSYIIGSRNHVVGPSTVEHPILIYGSNSGVDGDRIWFGGAGSTFYSNRFEIGEMVVLRGFAHVGNIGLFEVLGFPDNNTMAVGEILPSVIRDGRVSWLTSETSLGYSHVKVTGCDGGGVEDDGESTFGLEIRINYRNVSNSAVSMLDRSAYLCETLMLPDSLRKGTLHSKLLQTMFARDEIVNMEGWLQYGNSGMFRLGSFVNQSCWELHDIIPCEGGHLAWLVDEMNTEGAVVVSSAGQVAGPSSPASPIAVMKRSHSVWLGGVISPMKWTVGDLVTITGMTNVGNRGLFRVTGRDIYANSLSLGEVDENTISVDSCPDLPAIFLNSSQPLAFIPPVVPIDESIYESEDVIIAVRNDTCACPNSCSDHGKCIAVNDSRRCICACAPSWAGLDCSKRALPCPHDCSNHGECDGGTGKCFCAASWSGLSCDVRTLSCPKGCIHGTCDYSTGKCFCDSGWTGIACDVPVPTCRPSNCTGIDHGYCDLETKACVCKRAWQGADCDIPRCGEHGRMQPDGSCICDQNWFSPLHKSVCDTVGPLCSCSTKCVADGSSEDTCNMHASGCTTSGKCMCKHHWTGLYCDIPLIETGEINQRNFPNAITAKEFSNSEMILVKSAYIAYSASIDMNGRKACSKELMTAWHCRSQSKKKNFEDWITDVKPVESWLKKSKSESLSCMSFAQFMEASFKTKYPFISLLKKAIHWVFCYVDENSDGLLDSFEIAIAIVKRDCLNGDTSFTHCKLHGSISGNLTAVEMADLKALTPLSIPPSVPNTFRLVYDAMVNIRSFLDVNSDGKVTLSEWEEGVAKRPSLVAFPWPMHIAVDIRDRFSGRWCKEFVPLPTDKKEFNICKLGAPQEYAFYRPKGSASDGGMESDGDTVEKGGEEGKKGSSASGRSGAKEGEDDEPDEAAPSGPGEQGGTTIEESVTVNKKKVYGPKPEVEEGEEDFPEEEIAMADDSPFSWCDMFNAFSNIFCPTPNPIFNILIKIMIPGVIRPVIDMLEQKFMNGKAAIIQIVKILIPPEDALDGRAPPSFLEISSSLSSSVGYQKGMVVPYVKQSIYTEMVDSMTPSLTIEIHDRLYPPLHAQLHPRLMDSLNNYLNKTLSMGIGKLLDATVSAALMQTVPELVNNALILPVYEGTDISLIGTLTRSLTHAVSSTLTSSLATTSSTKFNCYSCKHYSTSCDKCFTGGGSGEQLQGQMYYNHHYAAFYSDYFADMEVEKARAKFRERVLGD
jgi:hypothetical protein